MSDGTAEELPSTAIAVSPPIKLPSACRRLISIVYLWTFLPKLTLRLELYSSEALGNVRAIQKAHQTQHPLVEVMLGF